MCKYRYISHKISAILVLAFLFQGSQIAMAQYFGRNKPSYRSFDFRVYQSPNFDIYHYFDNDSVVHALAETYEKWYVRHKLLFRDTFNTRNPIIIYANHPDFQQTTAVGGNIGIGTQGVTEALRNRIVMPVLETNAQTDHVIGHELVHAFHFRALFEHDSLSLNSIRNLPLWLVEGMAEYFSIGSTDTHTSMIMRDAIHRDDFPDLREMTRNYSYNPYRFGHAFIAFLGRTWGDSLIAPMYKETARFGYERAIERTYGLTARTISNLWKSSYQSHYEPLMADSSRHLPIGQRLVSEETAGEMNIGPSLSPDGRFIAFFSERDLFSIELFLADAQSGQLIRRLSSSVRNNDIDGFNFFESVGSWSPDGQRFVHVAVKQGANQLVIVDINRPRRSREIRIPGVPSLNNPSWSPDGRYIVFNGLVDGLPDLFIHDLQNGSTERLTNDRFSYIHPHWSPDGRYLVFSTDRPQTSQLDKTINFHFNLGVIDMHQREEGVRVLDIFPGAENLNPQFDAEQKGLYFLSNADGYRNLYYINLESRKVERLSDFYTGISGITHLSPAISVARQTGEIAYTHYQEGKYRIFKALPEDFTPQEMDPMMLDLQASVLPPLVRPTRAIVDYQLRIEPPPMTLFPIDSFSERPFERRFALTYIGNSGIGVATSQFGTGVAGGVATMFSDITGDNQLFAAVAVNGEVYDFGGQVGYLNQKGRIAWGGMVSHVPYPYARYFLTQDTLSVGDGLIVVDNLQLIMQRTFEDQVTVFAHYPFSTTRRLEAGASMAWYYFRIDAFNNYYQYGFRVGESRERLEAPPGFSLQRINLAYVGDRSFFGMASPIMGSRFRIGVEKFFGRVDMWNFTADYRRYQNFRPFTLAFRGIHFGRYGKDGQNDLFYPLYLGYPGWIRGFSFNTLYKLEDALDEKFTFDQLLGSRVLMGGLELRVPFTGPERLALISSNFLLTELAWFLDAGLAWNEGDRLTLDKEKALESGFRYPVMSTGPSLRINLFGALILEPYYAFPIHTRGIGKGVWGLNFLPGW